MSEERVDKAPVENPPPAEVQPARPAPATRPGGEDESERAEFLKAMEQDFDVQDSSRGEMVKGHVVSIGKEFIFVDLGGKSEGVISLEEFRGEGEQIPAVGAEIEACVVSTSGGVVLSRKLAKGVRDREALADAARNRIPVEGRVLERNKGGFVVDIAGVRAFCPISQIELRFCDNPDVHLGQRYSFLITKHELAGRRVDVVVSRKALLAAEAERQAEELRKTIKEGDVVSGTVVNIRDFGAFVDLGGIEGLLPISELSHGRVGKVSDVLSVGEEVHVQIVSYDRAKDRISLSLKRLEADPWEEASRDFPAGTRVKAKVVRLQPFGAFVELAPGLDGLIHVSNMNAPERVQHPKDLLKEGQEVTVEVISLDAEKRRIALARVPAEGEFGDVPLLGAVLEGIVDSHAPFGVFVKLGPGRKGLVPNVELGTSKGADNRKDFPEGSKIKVKVIEVTDNGKRIRLSRKAALDAEERADFEEYMGKDGEAKFGTLGDLLKAKLPRS